ncbi:MAG: hypothetical protein AAFZ65_03635, partial [Planctomycetota bacterium]
MDRTAETLFDAIDDGDIDATLEHLKHARGLLELRDEGGMTPLLRAAVGLTRDPALIAALLDAGADPRATTDDGETALHLLVDVEGDSGFGDEPLLLLRPVVDAGCPLEARSADGLTALGLAVVHGTPDEVLAFVRLGADVHVRLPEPFEPEDLSGASLLAAALGSPEKVEALVAAGADPDHRSA